MEEFFLRENVRYGKEADVLQEALLSIQDASEILPIKEAVEQLEFEYKFFLKVWDHVIRT